MADQVTLTLPDGALTVKIFSGAAAGAKLPPAILCIDGFGPRESLDRMAERIASAGYVVALPDLFYRGGSIFDLTALLTQARSLRTLAEEYADTPGCDIWDYQALRHALRPLDQHPYWSALATLRVIQHALLRTARGRYRRDGRILTGTQAYRSLLQEARMVWKEVEHADTASDG